ncbi:MAG: hypothetical protein IPG91_07175 [Ideonella sp.]|nr:hypothetical protein [Ideonella sp.]
MQSAYAASFDREMGCTEREWLSWLPGAVRDHALTLGDGQAGVAIGGGSLRLAWQALEPRQIALMRLPRLAVQFRFEGLSDAERLAFMRYFDLYMQRGGG